MIYLNENEEKIIGKFMDNEDNYTQKILTLIWSDGSKATARYDTFIEDESDSELDDEGYEEFWSFVFEKIEASGEPPIEVTEDNCFTISYHNFPTDIVLDGKKVN